MPLVGTGTKHKKSGKEKQQLDLYKFCEIVREWAPQTLYCVIEKVAAGSKQGVSSMFRFGENFGQLQGVCAANGLAIHFTPPSVWKVQMDLSRDKKLSIKMAKELFPKNKEHFKRVKDDGRAEAALLAKYGVRLLARTF